jgi:nucleotide-binding universal stress UspA family protein
MRILLPTDFSDNALHAARYAVGLFGTHDVTYFLLHAHFEPVIVDPIMTSYSPELVKASEEGLDLALKRFKEVAGAMNAERHLVYGPVGAAVRDFAREQGADLVVMGKRGGTGSRLFGSNTTDVIQDSRVPVLAVPDDAPLQPVHRILLGDDHDEVLLQNVSVLRTIVARDNAEVLVAHLPVEVPEGVDTHTGAYDIALKGVAHRFVKAATGEDAVDGLERTAHLYGADMICVLHRHLGFLQRLFRASTAKQLARHSDLPLLVLEQDK